MPRNGASHRSRSRSSSPTSRRSSFERAGPYYHSIGQHATAPVVPRAFTSLDIIVLVAYLTGIAVLGAVLSGRQHGARDYFLAGRNIPWWAICFSVVATETSALTFISIPATAYQNDLWFLQLACGYLIGRVIIAWVL